MNRRRYSALVKTILFGIQMLAIVTLAASVVLVNGYVKSDFNNLYSELVERGLWVMGISTGVWLFALCYLTVTAGRSSEDKEIHLFKIDRMPTEVGIAILFAGISIACKAEYHIAHQTLEAASKMVSAATIGLSVAAFFMLFYLSMVRKIKSDTFWSSSLTMWVFYTFESAQNSRRIVGKIIVIEIIKMIIGVGLALLTFGYKLRWALICLILFLVLEMLFSVRAAAEKRKVYEGIEKLEQGELQYKIKEEALSGENKELAHAINNIGNGLSAAISSSVKDERMKANLITNVSHDIKTPLTSIINYIGLLKMEDIQNENAKVYIDVLDQKAQRLKQLTEDLVEASRITTGNVTLQMSDIDFIELVRQTGGEFNERLEDRGLNIITKLPREKIFIQADGRQLWRVIGNLYSNVIKYAMSDTRVYVSVEEKDGWALFMMKNISADQVKVPTTDLTERFVRGDEARTTEGSGLGLSIAKSLTELMGGKLKIELDGDLFKVEVAFPVKT